MNNLLSYPVAAFQIVCVVVFFALFKKTGTLAMVGKALALLTSVIFFSAFLVSLFGPIPQRYTFTALLPSILGVIGGIAALVAEYTRFYRGKKLFAFTKPSTLAIVVYLLIIAYYIGAELVLILYFKEKRTIRTTMIPLFVVAATNEEMYFRYYLDDMLASAKIIQDSTIRAIVISILFSVAHMVGAYSIPSLVGRFIISLILVWVKRSMKNPVYPIFLHCLIDIITTS